MPGACIPFVIDEAKQRFNEWIDGHPSLCDLAERANFPDYPYDEVQFRILYILRYFPAYFFENHKLFLDVRRYIERPGIVSLGCGCLVDAAAALDVFDDLAYYDGYDINNWEIKAVEPGARVNFHHRDLFTIERFARETNVFNFSRSIGDLGMRLGELQPILENSNFESEQICICATYNVNNEAGIEPLRNRLNEFSALFRGYKIDEASRKVFNPGEQNDEQRGFARGAACWARHPDREYLTTLYRRCREPREGCSRSGCHINRSPILMENQLAYEFMILRRR